MRTVPGGRRIAALPLGLSLAMRDCVRGGWCAGYGRGEGRVPVHGGRRETEEGWRWGGGGGGGDGLLALSASETGMGWGRWGVGVHMRDGEDRNKKGRMAGLRERGDEAPVLCRGSDQPTFTGGGRLNFTPIAPAPVAAQAR
eukprot:356396-Chlamydomonas_euryale.AAC.7